MPRALHLNLFQSMPHANHLQLIKAKRFSNANVCVTISRPRSSGFSPLSLIRSGFPLSPALDIQFETIDFTINLQPDNPIGTHLAANCTHSNLITRKRKLMPGLLTLAKFSLHFFSDFAYVFVDWIDRRSISSPLNNGSCLASFCGRKFSIIGKIGSFGLNYGVWRLHYTKRWGKFEKERWRGSLKEEQFASELQGKSFLYELLARCFQYHLLCCTLLPHLLGSHSHSWWIHELWMGVKHPLCSLSNVLMSGQG